MVITRLNFGKLKNWYFSRKRSERKASKGKIRLGSKNKKAHGNYKNLNDFRIVMHVILGRLRKSSRRRDWKTAYCRTQGCCNCSWAKETTSIRKEKSRKTSREIKNCWYWSTSATQWPCFAWCSSTGMQDFN